MVFRILCYEEILQGTCLNLKFYLSFCVLQFVLKVIKLSGYMVKNFWKFQIQHIGLNSSILQRFKSRWSLAHFFYLVKSFLIFYSKYNVFYHLLVADHLRAHICLRLIFVEFSTDQVGFRQGVIGSSKLCDSSSKFHKESKSHHRKSKINS